MEVRGLILLRISDAEYGRIAIVVDNDDKLGFQLQVCDFASRVWVLVEGLKSRVVSSLFTHEQWLDKTSRYATILYQFSCNFMGKRPSIANIFVCR